MSNWEGRVEDFDLLTGRARFGGDLRVEGALWLGFVRSPVARAAIVAIDKSAAEALDGVAGVFTADDLELITQPSVEGITPTEISRPPLAQGSVAYVGEAVAAVVAISEAVAADACEMVEVDYEPLPPLSNLASATDEMHRSCIPGTDPTSFSPSHPAIPPRFVPLSNRPTWPSPSLSTIPGWRAPQLRGYPASSFPTATGW